MDHTLYVLHLLLLLLYRATLTSAAADSPMMFPSASCSDQLVTFSSCLPFVAVSPNNLTDFPPSQCCDDISSAFGNGSAICLCYFVLQPKILGFPLNSTKLLSLTSVCPVKDQNLKANFSLEELCSESAVLPPLRSITGPNNSPPRNSSAKSPSAPVIAYGQDSRGSSSSTKEPGAESAPPPLMGSAQESSGSPPSTNESTDELRLPSEPNFIIDSSATGKIYMLARTLLSFYLFMSISV